MVLHSAGVTSRYRKETTIAPMHLISGMRRECVAIVFLWRLLAS